MKIKFELEPGERDNIITRTEAFIHAINHKYSSEVPSEAHVDLADFEDEQDHILADLRCAMHIIDAYIDYIEMCNEVRKPIR